MDVDALRLLAALAGAVVVAVVAVAAALTGGPRRRPAMTLGVTGGRVRLPSRAMERMALVAVGVTAGLMFWLTPAAPATLITGTFVVVALTFTLRRGAMLPIAPREVGPDDIADDGYVDGPGAANG